MPDYRVAIGLVAACALTILFLGLVIDLAVHPVNVYCNTASRAVFDGEQNLCVIPKKEKTVRVKVEDGLALNFTHYLFDSQPPITSLTKTKRYVESEFWIKPRDFHTISFALPEGSVLKALLLAESSKAEWYLTAKYRESFKKIRKNKNNYLWSSSGSGLRQVSLLSEESKSYFLSCYIRDMYGKQDVLTQWDITIQYATYNLTNGVEFCHGESDCTLKNASGKYLVSNLQEGSAPGNSTVWNSIFLGNPKPDPERFTVFLVFLILSGVLALFLLVLLIVDPL